MGEEVLNCSDINAFKEYLNGGLEKMGYFVSSLEVDEQKSEIRGEISSDLLGFDPILVHAFFTEEGKEISKLQLMLFTSLLGDIKKALVITNSTFEEDAYNWANSCAHAKVVLLDSDFLQEYC